MVSSRPHRALQNKFNDSNPFEHNHINVICKIKEWSNTSYSLEPRNLTAIIKGLAVHVECICCPRKSGTLYSPLPSARHGGRSSSVPDNTEPSTLQPFFPTSWHSYMDHEIFNNKRVLRLSRETTSNGFHSGVKGFHNDEYDMILSSNAYPIGSLGYDDLDSEECQPPRVLDDTRHNSSPSDLRIPWHTTNGCNLGLGRLIIESTISNEFELGSSSMVHTFVNSHSDFTLYPLSKKMRTS